MRGGGRGEWEEEEEGEEEKQTMAPAQGLLCGLISRQSVGQSILICEAVLHPQIPPWFPQQTQHGTTESGVG